MNFIYDFMTLATNETGPLITSESMSDWIWMYKNRNMITITMTFYYAITCKCSAIAVKERCRD